MQGTHQFPEPKIQIFLGDDMSVKVWADTVQVITGVERERTRLTPTSVNLQLTFLYLLLLLLLLTNCNHDLNSSAIGI